MDRAFITCDYTTWGPSGHAAENFEYGIVGNEEGKGRGQGRVSAGAIVDLGWTPKSTGK